MTAIVGSACGDYRVIAGSGIEVRTGDNGWTSSGSSAVVGVWTRITTFTDAHGFVHGSRTTWEFRSDGSATRTLITQNLSLGLSDLITAQALWRLEGSTLVVSFLPPNAGVSRFRVSQFGSTLELDGLVFQRIG